MGKILIELLKSLTIGQILLVHKGSYRMPISWHSCNIKTSHPVHSTLVTVYPSVSSVSLHLAWGKWQIYSCQNEKWFLNTQILILDLHTETSVLLPQAQACTRYALCHFTFITLSTFISNCSLRGVSLSWIQEVCLTQRLKLFSFNHRSSCILWPDCLIFCQAKASEGVKI